MDTNVLVYAVSGDEPALSLRAMDLLRSLTADDTILLWQVASGFGAVVSRLRRRGRVGEDAFDSVRLYRRRFPLILPGPEVLNRGLAIHLEQQVSYWDSMLLAACEDAGVDRLYTQDVQGKPVIAGVEIVNPFAKGS